MHHETVSPGPELDHSTTQGAACKQMYPQDPSCLRARKHKPCPLQQHQPPQVLQAATISQAAPLSSHCPCTQHREWRPLKL